MGSIRSVCVEFVNETASPPGYLIAGSADLGEWASLWVGKLPIDISLAGDIRAGVAAAHRHDQIGPLGKLTGEQLGAALGQVDVKLAHDLDNLWMDALPRRRSGRKSGVPSSGFAFQ